MTPSLSPRIALRELILGLDCLMPYARQGATRATDAAVDISEAGQVLQAARRLESLPWTSVLEVSSLHLSAMELDALQSGNPPDPFGLCMANDYAWLLHVQPNAEHTKSPLGPGFAAIYALAVANGFTYVRLDKDAPVISALKVLA